MKTYTGMQLTNAAPFIMQLKEEFKCDQDLYKNLLGGMTIRECRVDTYFAELVFSGNRNNEPLNITVELEFRNKKKDFKCIGTITAEYTNLEYAKSM